MIRTDLTEFNKRFEAAARLTFIELGEIFQSQLTEEKRNYPRATIRRIGRGITGRFAGETRDVVDSKALVNSYSLEIKKKTHSISGHYCYTARHSLLVYTGHVTNKGTDIPPYPWIHIALRRVNLATLFKDHYERS